MVKNWQSRVENIQRLREERKNRKDVKIVDPRVAVSNLFIHNPETIFYLICDNVHERKNLCQQHLKYENCQNRRCQFSHELTIAKVYYETKLTSSRKLDQEDSTHYEKKTKNKKKSSNNVRVETDYEFPLNIVSGISTKLFPKQLNLNNKQINQQNEESYQNLSKRQLKKNLKKSLKNNMKNNDIIHVSTSNMSERIILNDNNKIISFFDIPDPVFNDIFQFNIRNVFSFAQTCKTMYNLLLNSFIITEYKTNLLYPKLYKYQHHLLKELSKSVRYAVSNGKLAFDSSNDEIWQIYETEYLKSVNIPSKNMDAFQSLSDENDQMEMKIKSMSISTSSSSSSTSSSSVSSSSVSSFLTNKEKICSLLSELPQRVFSLILSLSQMREVSMVCLACRTLNKCVKLDLTCQRRKHLLRAAHAKELKQKKKQKKSRLVNTKRDTFSRGTNA